MPQAQLSIVFLLKLVLQPQHPLLCPYLLYDTSKPATVFMEQLYAINVASSFEGIL